MADSTDLTTQIASTGAAPRRVSTDRLEAEAQPLQDLIAADRYLKAGAASKLVGRGLRFTKFATPGPTSDANGTSAGGTGIV
jgi:hypothetical protein